MNLDLKNDLIRRDPLLNPGFSGCPKALILRGKGLAGLRNLRSSAMAGSAVPVLPLGACCWLALARRGSSRECRPTRLGFGSHEKLVLQTDVLSQVFRLVHWCLLLVGTSTVYLLHAKLPWTMTRATRSRRMVEFSWVHKRILKCSLLEPEPHLQPQDARICLRPPGDARWVRWDTSLALAVRGRAKEEVGPGAATQPGQPERTAGTRTGMAFLSCGYESIPMKIPFLEGWTSINPSYSCVNYRGTRFWPTAMWSQTGSHEDIAGGFHEDMMIL